MRFSFKFLCALRVWAASVPTRELLIAEPPKHKETA